MHVDVIWLEWVSSRSGELVAFAVPALDRSRVITGARVPVGASPADPRTPKDPYCLRLLEGRSGAKRPRKPRPPAAAPVKAPDAKKPRKRPEKGTFTEASIAYCRPCKARTRWEPAQGGRYLMCVGCEDTLPCEHSCSHEDCADVFRPSPDLAEPRA